MLMCLVTKATPIHTIDDKYLIVISYIEVLIKLLEIDLLVYMTNVASFYMSEYY